MNERFLGEAQRLVWRLVTAPEGVRRGLSDAGDRDGRSLKAVVRGDASMDASARLTVYANGYFYRIRDALREDFGALHSALGERPFHNLVTAYLIAHPPTHPSLRYAGGRLPEFLAADPAARVFRARCPFVADLAALEWALLEAFDAPDALSLPRDALAAVPANDWAALRFELTPTLQSLTLAWPVHRARKIYDGGGDLVSSRLPSEETRLRVWRKSERVFYRPMSPLEQASLGALRAGACFGDVCERAAAETGDEGAARKALALLERWLADEILVRILEVPS